MAFLIQIFFEKAVTQNSNLRFVDIIDQVIREIINDGNRNPDLEDVRTKLNEKFVRLNILSSFLADQTNFDAFERVTIIQANNGTRFTPAAFQQNVETELSPIRRLIPQFDNPTISNQIRQRIEVLVRGSDSRSQRQQASQNQNTRRNQQESARSRSEPENRRSRPVQENRRAQGSRGSRFLGNPVFIGF